ncbi:hypothetical protein JCM8202_003721 [Rhodotorula sphaerocarpa]
MPSTPPITRESLATIPLCYATCSLGKPTDSLRARLQAISAAGFAHIEFSFPDLLSHASASTGKDVAADDYDTLCRVTEKEIKPMLEELNLKVFILQPFAEFEGWAEGSEEWKDAWKRVEGWIRIMMAVGTDTLQVGSSDAEKIDTSQKKLVGDLQKLCDRLKKEGFRVAYENWCWSTHAPNWKQAWKLIEAVDRDNMGYNPDSFQIAGAEWADPTAQDGLVEAASDSERNKRFEASLEELATTIPGDKIYFYQISDAYRVQPPLEKKTIDGLRPRGRWSGAYRPVPYSDGYLPVEQVTRAVLRTGFRGIFSLEVFDGGKEGKGKEVDFGEFAQDAMLSVQKLLDAVAEDGPCVAEST